MEIDSIVDAVTKEVMKKLGSKEDASMDPIAKVLVLEKHDSENYKTIERKLNFIGYKVGSIEDKKDIEEYDRIVITSLDNRELVNIAMGIGCDEKEQIVLESLLSGRKVFLIEQGLSYRKYKETSNKVLFKLYEDYEKRLKNFGIFIFKKENFIEGFNGCAPKESKPVSKEEDNNKNKSVLELKNKKLLTESNIKEACEGGYDEINIPKKAIITSLAIDCSKINGIKINKIY
ncbi:MAG TPA: hypothetical protein DD429_10065 [Clostridiaceae bacterium]|nr:hypothetical protein [Clostridiaceae bacterium]